MGDTVRVNYYNITETSQTTGGHTDQVSFEYWTGSPTDPNDPLGTTETDGRRRVTLKALDDNGVQQKEKYQPDPEADQTIFATVSYTHLTLPTPP